MSYRKIEPIHHYTAVTGHSIIDSSVTDSKVICISSDAHVHVLSVDNLRSLRKFFISNGRFALTAVKNFHLQPDLFGVTSEEGVCRVYDLRDSKPEGSVVTLTVPNDIVKPGDNRALTSFDVTCDDQQIVAGSSVLGSNVFLFFWDIRMPNESFKGAYWDSHSDDILNVSCHPKYDNLLATGSADNIVSIFDISESDENDALTSALTLKSDTSSLHWLDESVGCGGNTGNKQGEQKLPETTSAPVDDEGIVGGMERLVLTTADETYQRWRVNGTIPEYSCALNDLEMVKASSCNLHHASRMVNAFQMDHGLMVGVTSLTGVGHVFRDNFEGSMEYVCSLTRGHSDAIRSIRRVPKSNKVATFGEDGRISLWNLDAQPTATMESLLTVADALKPSEWTEHVMAEINDVYKGKDVSAIKKSIQGHSRKPYTRS